MSFRRSSLRFCFGAVALVAGVWMGCSAEAAGRERGRSIGFSQPRSDEVTTNLNQLTSRKDSLRQLEEDLNAPLQSFTPRSSLEGVVAPPPRAPVPSAVQSKRVKELLERRKNWVFMTPEDLLSGPTVDQILKTPEYDADGQPKKELPAMEQYYQRLMPKRPAKNIPGQVQTDDQFGPPSQADLPAAAAEDDSDLPGGVRESADALRSMFQSDGGNSSFARGATPGGLSQSSWQTGQASSREQMVEHKKLMDEYHSLIDPSWRPPVVASSGLSSLGGGGVAQVPRTSAEGLPAAPSPSPLRGLEAQMGIRHPLLGPPGLPDVNSRAVGQSRPAPALPQVREVRAVPTAPAHAAPKRGF